MFKALKFEIIENKRKMQNGVNNFLKILDEAI